MGPVEPWRRFGIRTSDTIHREGSKAAGLAGTINHGLNGPQTTGIDDLFGDSNNRMLVYVRI
jgi:hypothetical protein